MGVQPVSISRQTDARNYAAVTSEIINAVTTETIKAAAGAGVCNYVTSLQINTVALGGATGLALRDAAGSTVLWRSQLQTAALPIMSANFQSPLVGSSNTLFGVVTLTAATGGVFVDAPGYAGL